LRIDHSMIDSITTSLRFFAQWRCAVPVGATAERF